MVKNVLPRIIEVEIMYYIPLDGHTYPLFLSTNNPPYEELIVTINVVDPAVVDYVEIEPMELTFLRGEFNVNYTIWIKAEYPNS